MPSRPWSAERRRRECSAAAKRVMSQMVTAAISGMYSSSSTGSTMHKAIAMRRSLRRAETDRDSKREAGGCMHASGEEVMMESAEDGDTHRQLL